MFIGVGYKFPLIGLFPLQVLDCSKLVCLEKCIGALVYVVNNNCVSILVVCACDLST